MTPPDQFLPLVILESSLLKDTDPLESAKLRYTLC